MVANSQRTYIIRYLADNGLYEIIKFINIKAFFAFARILYRAKIKYEYKILEGGRVIFQK